MRCPFLWSEKLYLRPLEDSDLNEEYVQWLNDPEVTRYLGVGRFPQTQASIRQYLERFQDSTTDLILAIVDRKSNQHIGNITLNRISWIDRTADTGLMIGRRQFWGKGYAFEAWGLLIEHAFQTLGLRKIVAGAMVEHAASIAVLKRLGFQVEGVLRGQYFIDGEYRDAVRMGLFKEEFTPAGKSGGG